MRNISFVLLLAACGVESTQQPDRLVRPTHEGGMEEVLASFELERLASDGPMVQGTEERFLVHATEGARPIVSASGGELTWEGDELVWRLPEADRATLSLSVGGDLAGTSEPSEFSFMLIAVDADATGVVFEDEVGSVGDCALDVDSSDVPHIVYRENEHEQLWYAYWDGTEWLHELVDGPGFNTGDFIVPYEPAMLVDDNGVVHVAYYRDGGELMYAKRTVAGVWSLEVVDDDAYGAYGVAIQRDPDNNDRLTIGATVWHWLNGYSYYVPAVAYKSAGSWTVENAYGTLSNYRIFRGMEILDDGTTVVAYGDDYGYAATWDATNGWSDDGYIGSNLTNQYQPVDMDHSGDNVAMMHADYLLWSDDAGVTWTSSRVHPFQDTLYNAGQQVAGVRIVDDLPVVAFLDDNTLEFATVGDRDYWDYSIADTEVDYDVLGFDVDSTGELHACYAKAGELWFY